MNTRYRGFRASEKDRCVCGAYLPENDKQRVICENCGTGVFRYKPG